MSPRISLIVPTRNRAGILRLSLPRFLDQTVPQDQYEIVIVDDASEDDTAEAVARFAGTSVLYARNDRQRAAGLTRNRAIAMASGDLLLFVDDDALVRPDFVEEHLKSHAETADAIVAGPIIDVTEPPEERAPPAGRMLGRHTNPFATCNASVARRHILAAGGFDEDFRVYGWEDSEMYRRLRMLDLKRRYNWRAPVYHYRLTPVRRTFAAKLAQEENRGAMGAVYYAKHPTFGVSLETKLNGVFGALDAILDPILGLSRKAAELKASGAEPASGFWEFLLTNHTEIQAGRREWASMSAELRRELAERARAKVQSLG